MSVTESNAMSPDDILIHEILPSIFSAAPSSHPALVLLSGVAGSGASRATGRLLADVGGDAAVLRNADLSPFESGLEPTKRAGASLEWFRASIRHARESRQSLLLDGTLRSPQVMHATLDVFSAAGFDTRVVFVGSRRSDALLSLVSEHLRARRDGLPNVAPFPAELDASLASQRDVATALADASDTRVSVWAPNGDVVFDTELAPISSPVDALSSVENSSMSTLESVQWLSELRRVVTFRDGLRGRDAGLDRALLELHESALHDVIPSLQVDADSSRGGEVLKVQERAVAARLILLRRSLTPDAPRDAVGPVIYPPDRSASGPAR